VSGAETLKIATKVTINGPSSVTVMTNPHIVSGTVKKPGLTSTGIGLVPLIGGTVNLYYKKYDSINGWNTNFIFLRQQKTNSLGRFTFDVTSVMKQTSSYRFIVKYIGSKDYAPSSDVVTWVHKV
jgi:hypothetical protein